MEVKDLIVELLENNLEAEVEVSINSTEEDEDFEFRIEEFSWGSNEYLQLVVDLRDYVLVGKQDFDEMKEEIDELKSRLEESK